MLKKIKKGKELLEACTSCYSVNKLHFLIPHQKQHAGYLINGLPKKKKVSS